MTNDKPTPMYPTPPRLCVRCGRPVGPSEGTEHVACALRDRR
jgi:hypothetical protein